MKHAASLLLCAVWLTLSGCDGTCIGTGGIIDECKEGWTRDECAEWDTEHVNGSRWNFVTSTCDANGYTKECSDGSFVRPGTFCE